MAGDGLDKRLVAIAKKIRNCGKWRSKALDNVKQVDYFSGRKLTEVMLELCPDLVPDHESAVNTAADMLAVNMIARGAFHEYEVKKKNGTISTKKRLVTEGRRNLKQRFELEAIPYFWVYSVTPLSTYLIYAGILTLGAMIVTMPLWPSYIRDKTSYVSWGSIGLLIFLMALELVRYSANIIVWYASGKTVNFWILPNLDDEKLGFWESLKPLYSVDDGSEEAKEAAKKRKKSKTGSTSSDKNDKGKEDSNAAGEENANDEKDDSNTKVANDMAEAMEDAQQPSAPSDKSKQE